MAGEPAREASSGAHGPEVALRREHDGFPADRGIAVEAVQPGAGRVSLSGEEGGGDEEEGEQDREMAHHTLRGSVKFEV